MVNVRRQGRMTVSAAALSLAVATAVAGLGGCAATSERPLTAALFMPPASTRPPVPTAAPTEPAPVVQPARLVVPPDEAAADAVPTTMPQKAMILTLVPPQTFDTVKPLAPLTTPSPTTAPTADVAPAAPQPDAPPTPVAAAEPAAVASGVYMTVGGVLAQVNDTPIYAHTVLALLDTELAARARDMEPDAFRTFAMGKIVHQTQELIHDELDFTTADKALTDDDKKLANQIAASQEQDKVKQSGGSLELARRKAAEDGYDFDELMKRDYRRIVIGLYQRRTIDPQVQVSAQDMRDFYAANAAKMYGDKDRLRFRVIEIDPARSVGGASPRARAEAIRRRALAGEDFAALASKENDDDGLKATGGDPGGWMERGSYRVDAVENALWQLRPGGVTDVVAAEDMFYVAKLEDRHDGRTKPFDDPAVQDDVLRKLTQRQLSALWSRVRDSAYADAVVSVPEDRMTVALEMVMQKYARWTGR